jgi:hypothetical protein
MPTRREVIAFGASATMTALTGGPGASAATGPARLETRLFNFKDEVSPERAAALVAKFRESAKAAGLDGFLLGRNRITAQYPTHLEWMTMFQVDDFAAKRNGPAYQGFVRARDELASHFRNEARCDMDRILPAGYGAAPNVKVRHVVMFSFKPESSAEARERNVNAIREMGKLPMVLNYIVEPNAPSVSGPDQMEWQVIGDYASVADYTAYSEAPVHLAIRDDFTAHTSRVAFVDVEL